MFSLVKRSLGYGCDLIVNIDDSMMSIPEIRVHKILEAKNFIRVQSDNPIMHNKSNINLSIIYAFSKENLIIREYNPMNMMILSRHGISIKFNQFGIIDIEFTNYVNDSILKTIDIFPEGEDILLSETNIGLKLLILLNDVCKSMYKHSKSNEY